MNRRDNVKKFIIHFNEGKSIDIDLLELQLHSLYKLENINLDEMSYYNDLDNCNFQATTLNLAKKSFIKAVRVTLEKQEIFIEDFDISTIDSYSEYDIKMILDKEFVARNLRKEIREGMDNATGKKINIAKRLCRLPLVVVAYTPQNYLFNKEKLTKSATYKKMLDNLVTWEKDIIEKLIVQLRTMYIS